MQRNTLNNVSLTDDEVRQCKTSAVAALRVVFLAEVVGAELWLDDTANMLQRIERISWDDIFQQAGEQMLALMIVDKHEIIQLT